MLGHDARVSGHSRCARLSRDDGRQRTAGVSSDWRGALRRVARKACDARRTMRVRNRRLDLAYDRRRNARGRSGRRTRRQHSADDAILRMNARTSRCASRLDVYSRGNTHRLRVRPPIRNGCDSRQQELEDSGEKPAETGRACADDHCANSLITWLEEFQRSCNSTHAGVAPLAR